MTGSESISAPGSHPPVVNMDGTLVPADQARVPVLDRGFLYGDSVYEVVRTYGGRPFALGAHLDRLQRSAAALVLALPERGWLEEQIHRTIEAVGADDCYCRVIVTRGPGPITLDPTTATTPVTVILAKPFEDFPAWMYERGVKVHIARIRRNPPTALDPAIKSGNYLNSILALGEARRAGFDDALMLDTRGRVTEATAANVFAYRGGKLWTPALGTGILEGVTRAFMLRIATEEGLVCEESDLLPDDLKASDEVMLTSTLKEVMPVVQVGPDQVGDGHAGPLAARLHARYQRLARQRARNGEGT